MIDAGFVNNVRAGSDIDSDGNGYAYQFGSIPDVGFQTTAGIVPTTQFGKAPSSGTVGVFGPYEVYEVTDVDVSGGFISGRGERVTGDINLVGDFDDNTLTGSSGNLIVNGELNGNVLSGSVTYNGTRGALQGGADADKAVGAMVGNSNDTLFSGGFLGKKR